MSSSANPSSPPLAGSGDAPPIRTFQMDSGAIGNLSSSVNLFRGDVNLNQTLFTLPGRSQGAGLDVNLAVQYQSNVNRQATTWNRDAPTGVLGLGWGLPLTFVVATDQGSPVAATRQYTLYDNGSPNALAPQPVAPLLFTMDAGLAGKLHAGQPVPPEMLSEFHDHGLALDQATTVTGSGPWTLQDDALQQLFNLDVDGAHLNARDGGEIYQLDNYQFWTVVYYPLYERWVIVTDAAVRRSFGGVGPDTLQGYRTSAGNSIAWEVWWTDGQDAPVWSGPSAVTQGQTQVARMWYLVSVADRFGSSVRYGYNGWPRGINGLIPVVEQQVGEGGMPFTKAVYLTNVTDVFGRNVALAYGDKVWSAGDTDPREYADPHRAVPSSDPSPYQDAYETRYLDSLVVTDPSGSTLFTVRMTYDPRPEVGGPDGAVANVTSNTGSLEGDTYKRYLTDVTLFDEDGVAQPGMVFGYYLNEEAGASPGALATITYPEGGIATYSYTLQDLDLCHRSLEVPRPAEVPAGAAPRVYFGPDYAVVCYYNQNTLTLSFQVFTWEGSWLPWQLSEGDAVIDTKGLDLTTLEVLADQDFLALHFDRTSPAEKVIYVFQRDNAQPGQWQAATIDGTTTAKNVPSLTYSGAGMDVSFASGTTFFVVSQMDRATLKGTYDVVTFRWTTMQWTKETSTTTHYAWITAANEYLCKLEATDAQTGTLFLRYLDGSLRWQEGTSQPLSGLNSVDPQAVCLVPGAGLVVVGNVQEQAQQNITQVWIAQWNAGYVMSVSAAGKFTDEFGQGNAPTPWIPQIVGDSMVAVNGNLLRYNGEVWLENLNLQPKNPDSGRTQRYAFGPDYALQIIAPTTGSGRAEALVLSFVPSEDSDGWNREPSPPAQQLPDQTTLAQNWPSGGGEDYAVIGPYLYFRGVSSNWQDVVASDALADLQTLVPVTQAADTSTFNSESLVNEAPGFLAYGLGDGATIQEVAALVLANGALYGAPQGFLHQKICAPGFGGEPSGPGVSPAGPGVFVTYPDSANTFNDAPSIFLNHYTDRAVTGPIAHYAVARIDLDDGYQDSTPTAFLPDATTAGCDTSGQVVQYYQSTTYPGSTDPQTPGYGWVTSSYLNGLKEVTGDNYYDMLDGMLLRTETYDNSGILKQSASSTYTVFEQVSLDPQDPSAQAIQLRGGWVAAIRQETFTDGLTTSQDSSYIQAGFSAPFSAQPASTATTTLGGAGEKDVFTQQTTFGVQFDATLRAIHALGDTAEQVTLRSGTNLGDPVPVQATASAYAAWASGLGEGVQTSAQEATFRLLDAAVVGFPYTTYRPGDSPPGWQLSARVTRRTVFGQEQESLDSLGVPTATLYSLNGEFAVAKVFNAATDGTAYLGFQPYEDTTGWTLTGIQYDDDDARTGVRSAVLPTGAAVSVAVAPRNADAPYLAGCWYKTPAGFVGGSGSGLKATVTVDGVDQTPVFLPFVPTADQWSYVTLPIPFGGAGPTSRLGVAFSATNASPQSVLLDSLLLLPLVGGLIARTFDQPSQLIMSTMDAGGRTSRTYYDRAWQPTVSVGASGQVRELALRFPSRQGSPTDRFEPSSPNAELTIHPAAGGILETFRDGGSWQSHWEASNLGAHWSEGGGALTHTATTPDTLTWLGASPTGTCAVYFEFQASASPDVAVAIGDVSVGFHGGQYEGQQGLTNWTPLVHPPGQARHWLLVSGDGVVLFFGDGQLIFSEKTRPEGAAVVITTGGAPATFRHLSLVEDIRAGLSYNDAAGRQRQVQQLHGDDSIVAEIVFDPIGRQVATTRNAPGSFGTGAQLPVLAYSPGFLDVAGFLANLATTGEMTGDIASYYRGQADGPVHRTDDQGYPYRGTRYEDSPRNVRLESGRPGQPYAIDPKVPAASRQTLQYAWGTNGADGTGLPPNEYGQATLTSPVKTTSIQLTDKMGQLVATLYEDSEETLVSRTAGNRTYTDNSEGPEATLVTDLPNATTAGPQSDPGAFQRTSTADALQQPTVVSDPDSGETQFVFDSTGRMRFVQPALGDGEAWFIYYKYDPLGRITEQGTLAAAWDRAALMQKADDPSYPSSGGVVSVTTAYDGDGSDPTSIGKKHATVTHNPPPPGDPDAGDATVTETFGYDSSGQMVSVRMQLEGPEPAEGTVGYAYDVLSEVVRIDLPSEAPLPSVFYGYDDQGRVIAVGTAAGTADLGAYTYTPDGTVQTETLGDGSWQRAVSYASPGWVLSANTRSRTGAKGLGLTYTYESDGALGNQSATFDFAGDVSGTAATFAESFTYDEQRRLLTADGTNDLAITQYDPNGNMWSFDQNQAVTLLPCVPGSDQLQQVTIDEETSPVTYNARGQMQEGLGRSQTYDPATALTTSVAMPTAALRLAYGGTQQRILKQVRAGDGDNVVYFWGAGQFPVARRDGTRWSVLVQGPQGLLAVQDDRRLFPLKDPTGSTWAVVDADAALASYAYLPFGQQVLADDPENIGFPYLYQGQEWDAQVALYNFRARMYDAALCRFLSPDPARQFASPYVFAGNNPLTVTDPTGDISLWAQVGIGAAMVAITAIGIGLTLFTGGASDAAAASADAALLGSAGAAEGVAAATDAAVLSGAGAAEAGAAGGAAAEGTASAASAAGAAGAAQGAAAGASEVAAGASATEAAATTGSGWSSALTTLGTNIAGSTLSGAGQSGLAYDIQHGRDFTAKGFFEAVGIGAASGAVSGFLGGAGGLAAKGLTAGIEGGAGILARVASSALVGAVSGAASSDVSTILTNVAQHQPWYQGLAMSTLKGAGTGAAIGTAGSVSGDRLGLAKQAGVSDETVQKITTLVAKVQAAATTDDAYMIYGTAAFFVATGYVVWGAADNWGRSS